jgi:hypothetical protein
MYCRGFSAAFAAMAFLCCSQAEAAGMVIISGSGTFGESMQNSDLTAAGESFAFSFLEPDPVTSSNPFGGTGSGLPVAGTGYSVPFAGSFSYSLNGTPVQIGGHDLSDYLTNILFYDDNMFGGLDINFQIPGEDAFTLSLYTADSLGNTPGLLCDADNGDTGCDPGSFKFIGATFGLTEAANDGDGDGSGSLTIAAADVPPTGPSAVPEPATWVELLLGFGLLGALLRRRRAEPLLA